MKANFLILTTFIIVITQYKAELIRHDKDIVIYEDSLIYLNTLDNETPTIDENELQLTKLLIKERAEVLRILAFAASKYLEKTIGYNEDYIYIKNFEKYKCLIYLNTLARNSKFLMNYENLVSLTKEYKKDILLLFDSSYEWAFKYLSL